MHHPPFTPSTPYLSSHIHKTVDLPPHIASLLIPPILTPLTTKDAAFRCLFGQDRLRTIDQRQPLPLFTTIMRIILPRSITNQGGVSGVQKGLMDNPDYRLGVQDKGDGDAEHGEEVRVIYCSIKRVHYPGW